MNKKDFESRAERISEFRKWEPKQKQVAAPSNQQTSDEFIAQGGKCIYGKPLDFSHTRASRKTGFLFQSYLR